MALVEYARRELTRAGVCEKDADYEGMLGDAVMELVETFARQGHSGASAERTLALFNQVVRFKPLTKIGNPMDTGEYIDHGPGNGFQSTRDHSVFSMDGGRTWYRLLNRVSWWQGFVNRIRRGNKYRGPVD